CGISETIIYEKLLMKKLCARRVPRMLRPEMKTCRVECSRELLSLIQANESDFFARIVTGDETGLHHWDPESKQESMQWKHLGSPPPLKFRTQPSAGKIMATVFWDFLIDYLPRKTTMNGVYFAGLLVQLRQAIKEQRRGKLRL